MSNDIEMTPGSRDPNRYRKHAISAALLTLIVGGASAPTILDALLDETEGSRLVAYQDGVGIWTICKGLTVIDGKPVRPGMKLTAQQCKDYDTAFIERDLREAQDIIKPARWAQMSEASKAAAGDFVHNLGKAKARDSSYIHDLNEGRLNEACASITLWIRDRGKDCRKAGSNCQGQPMRRMKEDELCLMGDVG